MNIVFTKSKKRFPIGSWIIMLYQKTNYSHVALEVGDYFYQASDGKVNKEHKQHFIKKHEIMHSMVIPRIDLKDIETDLGRDYGLAQNIGMAVVDLFKLFKKKITNPFKSGVNCSEFIYERVIIQLYGDLGFDKDSIKPKHVKEILDGKNKV